jgi:small subunit ribosomal protein S16
VAVAIRLTRVGATKRPAYRVIAIDKRRSRDGRALEILGYYDPLTEPATVHLETERINAWIGKGALPSETVAKLMRQADAAAKGEVTEKPKRATRPSKPSKKSLAKAAAAEEAAAAPPEPPAAAEVAEPVADAGEVSEPPAAEAEAAEIDTPATDEQPAEEPPADEPPAQAPGDEAAGESQEAPGDDDAPGTEKVEA